MLVADEMRTTHPDRASTITCGLRNYAMWLFRKSLFTLRIRYVFCILFLLFRAYPKIAIDILFETARLLLHRARRLGSIASEHPGNSEIGNRFVIGESAGCP